MSARVCVARAWVQVCVRARGFGGRVTGDLRCLSSPEEIGVLFTVTALRGEVRDER